MDNKEHKIRMVLNRVNEKMNDPKLNKKVLKSIKTIEDIFEAEVDINVVVNLDLEDYKLKFKKYFETGQLSDENNEWNENTITLGQLKKILNKENDHNLRVCFDSLYMEHGINQINGILITTIEDALIIVPTKEKKDE